MIRSRVGLGTDAGPCSGTAFTTIPGSRAYIGYIVFREAARHVSPPPTSTTRTPKMVNWHDPILILRDYRTSPSPSRQLDVALTATA